MSNELWATSLRGLRGTKQDEAIRPDYGGMKHNPDTIVALATGRGGAIAVIRVSGGEAIAVAGRVFAARNGRSLSEAAGYTVHLGEVRDGEEVVDEVLVTVFRVPHSYTGEDSVEISCHASPYIENRIVQLLIGAGARAAGPGEFTVRAFLAGKIDLAQAEAVADLIAASGRAQHTLAMGQLRGGVSSALAEMRGELTELAALLELELDFGEEEVEFASRERLAELAARIAGELDALAASFTLGNAIRQGVPVAIVGRPNAGKSTLLNALVGDDRAMVSEIAGTTRDRVEERTVIGGVDFRFIDTAGLRATGDPLERMGIERAREAVAKAFVVLLLTDASGFGGNGHGGFGYADGDFEVDVKAQIADLGLRADQRLCVVVNKIDKNPKPEGFNPRPEENSAQSLPSVSTGGSEAPHSSTFSPTLIPISAKTGQNLDALRQWLSGAVDVSTLEAGAAVISGARHYEALTRAREAIGRVIDGLSAGTPGMSGVPGVPGVPGEPGVSPGMSGMSAGAPGVSPGMSGVSGATAIPTDLLAEDLREVTHHLGTITGAITTEELLATIFSKFCIGK